MVDDPACSQSTKGGYEAADPLCANRKDDDGDGLIDALDPGCQNHLGEYTPLPNNETNPQCSDGIDNDGDGLVDHLRDPGCGGLASGYAENIDPACADGRDNDGDGNIDYPQDPGCSGPFDNQENNPECSDNQDNDGDETQTSPMIPIASLLTKIESWPLPAATASTTMAMESSIIQKIRAAKASPMTTNSTRLVPMASTTMEMEPLT